MKSPTTTDLPNEVSDNFFSNEEREQFFRDFKIKIVLIVGTASLVVIGTYIFTFIYLTKF